MDINSYLPHLEVVKADKLFLKKLTNEWKKFLQPLAKWFTTEFSGTYKNGFPNNTSKALLSLFYFIVNLSEQMLGLMNIESQNPYAFTSRLDYSIVLLGGAIFEAFIFLKWIQIDPTTIEKKSYLFCQGTYLEYLHNRSNINQEKKEFLEIFQKELPSFLKQGKKDLLALESYYSKWYLAFNPSLNFLKLIKECFSEEESKELYAQYQRYCSFKHTSPYMVMSQWPLLQAKKQLLSRDYKLGFFLASLSLIEAEKIINPWFIKKEMPSYLFVRNINQILQTTKKEDNEENSV